MLVLAKPPKQDIPHRSYTLNPKPYPLNPKRSKVLLIDFKSSWAVMAVLTVTVLILAGLGYVFRPDGVGSRISGQ